MNLADWGEERQAMVVVLLKVRQKVQLKTSVSLLADLRVGGFQFSRVCDVLCPLKKWTLFV
jgi:hypothetical protein